MGGDSDHDSLITRILFLTYWAVLILIHMKTVAQSIESQSSSGIFGDQVPFHSLG